MEYAILKKASIDKYKWSVSSLLFSKKDAEDVWSQKKSQLGILTQQTGVILEMDTDWRLIDIICAYFLSSQKVRIHKVQQQSFCSPPKHVGKKCKALVPLFLNPKYTKTLWGFTSKNN